jgi:hypothetical protein
MAEAFSAGNSPKLSSRVPSISTATILNFIKNAGKADSDEERLFERNAPKKSRPALRAGRLGSEERTTRCETLF